jgi:YD repeat-containing protein
MKIMKFDMLNKRMHNAVVLIDPKQNGTQGIFDGASRPIGNTQWFYNDGDGSNALSGNSINTTRTVNGNGLVTQLKDGNGNVTGFNHDTLDRLILTTFPDGSTRANQYNEASDVTVYTDELGTTFTNGLDALGRVTGITLGGTSPGGGTTSQSFQFNGLSQPTQGVDTGDITTTVNLFPDSISRNVEEEHIFGGSENDPDIFGYGQSWPSGNPLARNWIFGDQIFDSQHVFLIDLAGDRGQKRFPFHTSLSTRSLDAALIPFNRVVTFRGSRLPAPITCIYSDYRHEYGFNHRARLHPSPANIRDVPRQSEDFSG